MPGVFLNCPIGRHDLNYDETCFITIPLLTAFRWSAGRKRGDGEEQQDSQYDGLHDDCSVERAADGMLWEVNVTEFIP